MIVYTAIDIDDVIKYDKERFNSNNHEPRPDDYRQVIESGNTKFWVDYFHTDYDTYTIKVESWMKEASVISQQTGKFSELYEDELNDMIDLSFNPCFIRCENVSLKYGQHGPGPYNNLKQVMESIVSSIPGHTPLYEDTEEIKLYMLPWLDLNPSKEFRIFVYKGRITAISQQDLFNVYEELEQYIKAYVAIIIVHFNSEVKNKIKLDSYVYDFAILENNKPYFIELNSFGKGYASGSALFHWLLDEEILYNENGDIHVRFTKR